MTDYTPMTKGEADEFMVALVETIEAQGPDGDPADAAILRAGSVAGDGWRRVQRAQR